MLLRYCCCLRSLTSRPSSSTRFKSRVFSSFNSETLMRSFSKSLAPFTASIYMRFRSFSTSSCFSYMHSMCNFSYYSILMWFLTSASSLISCFSYIIGGSVGFLGLLLSSISDSDSTAFSGGPLSICSLRATSFTF